MVAAADPFPMVMPCIFVALSGSESSSVGVSAAATAASMRFSPPEPTAYVGVAVRLSICGGPDPHGPLVDQEEVPTLLKPQRLECQGWCLVDRGTNPWVVHIILKFAFS
jgi:hypothetical protein